MDQAARAAAVAAKLSQTLLAPQNSTLSQTPTTIRQPVVPNVMSVLGLNAPVSINVPSNRVGQIIGKGGMKIREIQEKAQVRMDIAKESHPNTPHLREVKLTGSMEGIEKCKKLLEELYEEIKVREGGFSSGLQTPDRTIEIPIHVVGLVIGKGGETIRKIIQDTGCIVHVEKNENWQQSGRTPPKPGHQNVYFKGAKEAVDAAERAIQQLVAGAGDQSRRRPQNYPYGGQKPPYRMHQGYPSPYGMPLGPYGNQYPPGGGHNYGPPQPYQPPVYTPPNPYQPSNPYQYPVAPQAQGFQSQPQPYPSLQPYQQPDHSQTNSSDQQYNPAQATYNPAEATIPNHQNPVAPHTEGQGGSPYNPADPGPALNTYSPGGTVPPTQQSINGQRSVPQS